MAVTRHIVKVTPGKGYKRTVPIHYKHHSRPRPRNVRHTNY